MILGSLESQQQALQLYGDKHHSPTKEDKIKLERFDLSIKDEPIKPLIIENATSVSCKICFL
jgi:hypothetical protein